jgi:hypothetical protein
MPQDEPFAALDRDVALVFRTITALPLSTWGDRTNCCMLYLGSQVDGAFVCW